VPTTEHLDVTVVIPTIGRVPLLQRCLESLAKTRPLPAEVLVVDQSHGPDVAAMQPPEGLAVRVVACEGRGIARGLNLGLREAHHDRVLVTHDDCTVAEDWVAVGHRELAGHPAGITSGQVLPVGDPRHVPSIKVDDEPHDFTGELVLNGLYGNNLALPRQAVLDFGGFDERDGFRRASEDNDMCYRWLRAGRTLRYVPEYVVWHHDWRSPDQLAEHYRAYARSDGVLYAKYLLRRDWSIVRFLVREIYWGVRGTVGGVLRRRPAWHDPRRAILRSMPAGLVAGVREELAVRRASRAANA
jgi:GT2 family glycosyltransferase